MFGGTGDGDGPERRARLLLGYEEGASEGTWSRGEAIRKVQIISTAPSVA